MPYPEKTLALANMCLVIDNIYIPYTYNKIMYITNIYNTLNMLNIIYAI